MTRHVSKHHAYLKALGKILYKLATAYWNHGTLDGFTGSEWNLVSHATPQDLEASAWCCGLTDQEAASLEVSAWEIVCVYRSIDDAYGISDYFDLGWDDEEGENENDR